MLTEQLALAAVRCSRSTSPSGRSRRPVSGARIYRVTFKRLQVPKAFPDGRFDLVVVSEVGHYRSMADLRRSRDLIIEHLKSAGR